MDGVCPDERTDRAIATSNATQPGGLKEHFGHLQGALTFPNQQSRGPS